MLRKMMYMTFTFFVLSLFTYQTVCHAHMNENPEVFEGHTTTRNAWNSAYHDMNAKYQIMDNQYNIFTGAKSAVENLNTIWSDHQRKLAAGKTATVENETATSNSLSAMDAALATLKQTDPLYKTLYNAYLGACANHKITRASEWNKTYNQAEIDAAVKAFSGGGLWGGLV